MDVESILKELRAERDSLEEAILGLERLARSQTKRRGRPPKWMQGPNKATAEAPKNAGVRGRIGEDAGDET
jgi:hypothetical protein